MHHLQGSRPPHRLTAPLSVQAVGYTPRSEWTGLPQEKGQKMQTPATEKSTALQAFTMLGPCCPKRDPQQVCSAPPVLMPHWKPVRRMVAASAVRPVQ